ncbi:unnamed protein product [Schistocephalus solidus]|uniref:Reverse transcriptase domain-containing protein n=1 Tax=Schistocephalus solidus TaxID=70667 RepID=A0A183TIF5_SCHSO|nr:unnamed protein product [Schistocephalus solidus]
MHHFDSSTIVDDDVLLGPNGPVDVERPNKGFPRCGHTLQPKSATLGRPSRMSMFNQYILGQEMRTHIYTTFVDLTKAFDTVIAMDCGKLCRNSAALSGSLTCLMFSAMLMDAYRDEQPGIRIAFRTDRHLLNSRRMQASTRVSTTTVHDLLFADGCTLNSVTEEAMQRSRNLFTAGCANFGETEREIYALFGK